MLPLLAKIRTDHTEARKARNTTRLSTLTMLLADISNATIANKGELSQEKLLTTINSHLTKLYKEADAVEAAGRDTASLYTAITEIKEYLPAPLTDEEIQHVVLTVMEKSDNISDVMKECRAVTGDRFDARRFAPLVKAMVNSKMAP